MKIWLNTSNIQTIREGVLLGLLQGVVLRPKDLKETKKATEKLLVSLMNETDGLIAVPIALDNPDEMIREGQEIYHFSKQLIPSIPACKEGYEAIFRLSRLSIPTFASCITAAKQGFLSIQSGARYIEPHFSAMQGGWEELLSIKRILDHTKQETESIIASLNNVHEIIKCFESGFEGVNISKAQFDQLLEAPQNQVITENSMESAIR